MVMPSRRYIDRCTDARLTLTDDQVRDVTRRAGLAPDTDRHITVAVLVGIPMVTGLQLVCISSRLRPFPEREKK